MADAAAAEAERKRVRGRAYVKRFYEKKKATLAALQAELAALDVQYTTLAARAATTPLKQQYDELTQLKQRLYEENDALRAHAADHMIREARLQQIVDMDRPAPRPFQFRWLTVGECQREAAACRAELERFLTAATPRPRAHRLKVFGWSDQRDVADGKLAFAFEKTFADSTPHELVDRTWRVFEKEATHGAIFSASMNARVRVLQRVDDDAMLFYWHLQPDEAPFTIKCVFLMLRFPIADGGWAVVCRYVDKDAIALDDSLLEDAVGNGRPVYWAKMETSTIVQRCGESGKDASYLFQGATMARVWTIEVLLICMRFESLALGARMLPPSS